MIGRLGIKTFGDLAIQMDGEPVAGFSSRKVEALLVYLAVERATAHRRESLLTLLWPGMPEKSARNNLRQVLFSLRQILPEVPQEKGVGLVPLLLADRQTVQINPEAFMEVDIHRLDGLLVEAQNHDHLNLAGCETCTQSLEAAVSLYSGSFLADFYLEDSNPFEEWAEATREACRRKVLEALASLTDIRIQQGRYDRAWAYADQQIRTDPLRESAYRQMMELLSKGGQRAEALRVFQRCVDTLDRELGAQPSRETTALYEIISGEVVPHGVLPQKGYLRGYEIRGHLGSGHTGMVYRAFQPVVNRDVAVKVIRPEFANHPDFIRRFEIEAQLVARLEHPHIVPLYDFWRDPSGAYLVMRWIKGGSLQTALANGPWKPLSAVRLIDQLAAALALAHRQGVVHCDIKPANILVDEDNNAYLTDFGIAILTGPLAALGGFRWAGEQGTSSGSLGYSSPEVTRGLELAPTTDLYSLGVVLYEILTGVHPFPGLSGDALVAKHLSEQLPLVMALRADLPVGVDAVIQKATEKDPAKRFQDVHDLAEAFRTAVAPEHVRSTSAMVVSTSVRNPYKGLRPFREADATDFFGREELVERLLDRMKVDGPLVGKGTPFLAVVGPSGSGKSSAVKAGLVPAIRAGALPGSERWFVAEMTPGSHPLEELENALMRIAIETPKDLLAQLKTDRRGLVRVLKRALPGVSDEIMLVIDQFEETFTLVEAESEREHFLDVLATAVNDPHSPLQLVVSLRADFYDRPLQYSQFGALVREHTEVVLPLTPAELERAICAPAEQVGVALEPALVVRMVQNVGDQPGALPLLQYALTELFEHREGNRLSLAAYQSSGGILGVLGSRAEDIYAGLDLSEQEDARQIFLRLVTLGEGTEDIRRRALLSELLTLSNDPARLTELMDTFGRYRLVTFDHDPVSRRPTVEVAHEALLREWPRLRTWLDESRDDVRTQRLLSAATVEWVTNAREESFLLRGTRLDQFSEWAASTSIALTEDEHTYLEASLTAKRWREQTEFERQAREKKLEQRSYTFARLLTAVFAMAAVVAAILSVVAFNQREIARENAATATVAQGEALVLADARATQQALAEAEAQGRATQQAIAVAEAEARGIAEEQALADRDRAVAAEQDALRQASIGLAAQAQAEMKTANSERGVLLALAALEEYPYTPQAEAALANAVQDSLPYKEIINKNGNPLNSHWVAWSPDGTQVALGASTNDDAGQSGVVFDAESGDIDLVLPLVFSLVEEHYSKRCAVHQINWSPDGTRLALVSNNFLLEDAYDYCHHLEVFDAQTGNRISVLETEGEFAVDWSPDGSKLLTGGEGGRVKIWDAQTGEVHLEMQGHEDSGWAILPGTSDFVVAARYSPDGRRAATFMLGGSLLIWDTSTGELLQSIDHPPGLVSKEILYDGFLEIGLAWSPSGDRLATSWFDGLGRVWDPVSGDLEMLLSGHDSNMMGIDWSPNGEYILTNSWDGTVRLWLASTGQMVIQLPSGAEGNVAWSPDGDRIASSTQGSFHVWSLSGLPPVLNPLVNPENQIWEGQWSPDGSSFVVTGKDGLVFDWEDGRGSRRVAPNMGMAGISPDGNRMVSTEGETLSSAQIIDLHSGEVLVELNDREPQPKGYYFTHTWSNDGTLVASSVYGEFRIVIWDPETGEELSRTEVEDCLLFHHQFSPDNYYLAASCIFVEGNTPIYIIDPKTGGFVRELPSENGWSDTVKWSPDGKALAVGYQDGTLKLWDTGTWTIIREYNLQQGMLFDLDWSPNGKRIVSADVDYHIVRVLDVETGDTIMTWKFPFGGLNDVDWSPDGQFISAHGMTGLPIFRRVWQSTQELIDYAYECCVWRQLTPVERVQFGLPVKP